MTKEEERKLIQSAGAGNTDAFETIVQNHERLLYNLALRMLGTPEDAADAVQEAFLKAYTGLSAFRGDSRLSVWLCRILNNVCIDTLRKRKDTLSLSRGGEDDETPEGDAEVPDERYDPAQILQRQDLQQQVRAAVDLLPPDFRMPLLLRVYDGMTYEEISRVLSLDMGTVKTRIYRARKKLCVLLSDDGNFPEKSSSKETKGGVRA